MLQRLRRAEALARNALDVADQFVDPRAHPLVRLPVQIVVQGGFGRTYDRRPSKNTCDKQHILKILVAIILTHIVALVIQVLFNRG
jgi:hypothetical protein